MDKFDLFLESSRIKAPAEEMPFVRMILSDPKNKDNYLFYADWLQENGDIELSQSIRSVVEGKFYDSEKKYPFHKKLERHGGGRFGLFHVLRGEKNSWKGMKIIVIGGQEFYHSLVEPGKEIYVIGTNVSGRNFVFYYWKNTTKIDAVFATPKEADVGERLGKISFNLYFKMLYNINIHEMPNDILYYLLFSMLGTFGFGHCQFGSIKCALGKL